MLSWRDNRSSPGATTPGGILHVRSLTGAAFILTGSVERNFVLVGVFEQVLGVVEPSSLEPLWDIRDPFGYIHNLEYTPTKHTRECCTSDDCILKVCALNRILVLDVPHTFTPEGLAIKLCLIVFLLSSRVTYKGANPRVT